MQGTDLSVEQLLLSLLPILLSWTEQKKGEKRKVPIYYYLMPTYVDQ